MKKVLLFVAVVFAASFASCKKDYQCDCKVAGTTISSGTFKDTKKNAEDACDALNVGITADCEAVKQ